MPCVVASCCLIVVSLLFLLPASSTATPPEAVQQYVYTVLIDTEVQWIGWASRVFLAVIGSKAWQIGNGTGTALHGGKADRMGSHADASSSHPHRDQPAVAVGAATVRGPRGLFLPGMSGVAVSGSIAHLPPLIYFCSPLEMTMNLDTDYPQEIPPLEDGIGDFFSHVYINQENSSPNE